MASKRDTSRDGLRNKVESYALTNFKPIWGLIQSNEYLRKKVNKTLINNAIYKVPTRPYAYSTMSDYTSWDSLTDRSYSGLHLKPQEKLSDNLPKVEELASLFKKTGSTKYSPKSTLLFPYFVQWFTDGFLRSDRQDHRKNHSHHQIDLCNVYGLTPEITNLLRSHKGGKLKSQMINDEEYPPFYYDENAQPKQEFIGIPHQLTNEFKTAADEKIPTALKPKLFATGVELERGNVQIGYVMLNILILREHNRLCDLLAKEYPHWDDERLFQTARNITIVLLMRIIMEEYINHITPYNFKFITDPLAFSNERWYRPNWMTVEFTLVYRWHSTLPDTVMHDGQNIPMTSTMWNNELIINKGLGALFEETCSQPSARLGLFNTADFLLPTELASIRLGRQTRIRSYNDYREMCKFPRVTKFNQISSDERVQEELKCLYGHVDNIEFYVGLYAEDLRENSTLPPLVGRMVGIDAFSQALTNPLLAENTFNPDTFSKVGWEVIHNTNSLTDILHRNIPQKDKTYKVTFDREGVI